METYPRLIAGKDPIQKYLESMRDKCRVYPCSDIKAVRKVVSDLCFMGKFPDPIAIYLKNPNKRQFDVLLKFLEESLLDIVILVPYDSVPATIVSRVFTFSKEEKVEFKDYLDEMVGSESLRRKILEYFGRSVE